ncbi:MAG: hypothetical protein HQL55_11595 [Magnetococcales bacterium]|nr:hypothetical protein [Magnetococcales bacterium]
MMHAIAKVVYREDVQEIHLPRMFHLNASEVMVHTNGDSLVLTPCRSSWEGFVEGFSAAEDGFRKPDEENAKDLPRKTFE